MDMNNCESAPLYVIVDRSVVGRIQVRNEDGRVVGEREGFWWCDKGSTRLHKFKWEAQHKAIYPKRVLGTALAACRTLTR